MFAAEYREKLVSAEQAVKVIESGDWVDYGFSLAHPVDTDRALAARARELSGVKVRGGLSLWLPALFQLPEPGRHFTWNAWHCSGFDRKILELGCGYYSPMRYSELPRYYRDNALPVDVAMFRVGPMDSEGYFNLGPQSSHLAALCERARHIVVEVNRSVPRCLGGEEHRLHLSKVGSVVEGSNSPLAQLGCATVTEIDRKVARSIIEEIPDAACLQLGIGGMPSAVGQLISDSDLKDLGVHTEMYNDALMEISLTGKINGSRKNIDRGRQVYTFCAGSRKLYDFLHDNPELVCRSADYTNDVQRVAQQDNFISINSALEVDLFGQVSSESAGIRHISGTGGQLDFVLGAYLSKGGKSFICLPSSYGKKGDPRSRIVPTLPRGSIVTAPRTCVQWVVTEFGKVNLKGKSNWERAEALISIAHPDFREQLVRQAQEMNIWRNSNRC